jgi:hypothetical protein
MCNTIRSYLSLAVPSPTKEMIVEGSGSLGLTDHLTSGLSTGTKMHKNPCNNESPRLQ